MNNRFSFASVILSYFLVGGGMFAATLVGRQLEISGELVLYAMMAAGAFVGGFIAARASRGQTILEPAIGALAVVATIVGLAATTPIGQLIWSVASDETMKFVGAVGLASAVGAIAGAFVSEKVFGEATRSSVPWIVYSGFATFGACLVAALVVGVLVAGRDGTSDLTGGVVGLGGIGLGCLLSGLAVGASARARPLVASLVGGSAGVAGFFWLLVKAQVSGSQPSSDAIAGLAMFAVAGGIITLIGTVIGWAAVGRKHA